MQYAGTAPAAITVANDKKSAAFYVKKKEDSDECEGNPSRATMLQNYGCLVEARPSSSPKASFPKDDEAGVYIEFGVHM